MRGREPDVAGERELGGAGARDAVERGDDDLRQRLERVVHPVGRPHQLEDLLLGIARPHAGIEDPHREELRAAAGEHDGLGLRVAGQVVDDRLEPQQHLAREPILIGRAIDGDRHHPAVTL